MNHRSLVISPPAAYCVFGAIVCVAIIVFKPGANVELLERAVSAGETWQARAKKLDVALEAAKRAIEIGDGVLAKTPFQFAQDSARGAENIEFTIDGQPIYLVGPGAQAARKALE